MALNAGSTLNPGRTIAWPLIVGGGVLAVAWSARQTASGKNAVDLISVAACGLGPLGRSPLKAPLCGCTQVAGHRSVQTRGPG